MVPASMLLMMMGSHVIRPTEHSAAEGTSEKAAQQQQQQEGQWLWLKIR
jgi:hypothetical protein